MNSTYWANKIMDQIYTNGTDEFWLGLSHTMPDIYGGNVSEPTASDYGRVRVVTFSAPSNGFVYNTSVLEFPICQTEWFSSDAKAAYWVLFDGSGADANVLSAGELEAPITVDTSMAVSIAVGAFGMTLTDDVTIS